MVIEIKDTAHYSVAEVKEMFGVGAKAVYSWVKRGMVVGSRVGKQLYISGRSLNELIKRGVIKH